MTDILIRWVSESAKAVSDMKRVEKALGDTQDAADRNARRWSTASRVMRTAGMAMGTALVGVAVKAGKAAAVQEQAIGGMEAVFKRQAPQMRTWARGMSDVGLSMTDAATFASRLGASLKGAGMPLQQAADQTRRLTELGADLAATFGGTTADAVTALGAALRGEYDPLERFGAALKASEVSALLAKRGQDGLTGAARNQAEMAARLDLIWKRTGDAQGQAAREADTSAAAWQRFRAKLDNATADLGTALLPVMEDVAGAMADLADAADRNPDAVRNWAKAIAALTGSLLALSYASGAVTTLKGVAGALSKFPKAGALTLVAAEIAALHHELSNVTDASPDALKALKEMWNWKPGESGLYAAFDDLWNWLQSFETSGLWQGLRLGLAQVTDAIGITQGRYDELKREFANPIKAQIDASNRKALDAANVVEQVLNSIARAHPKATIDAANAQARQAAREAQNAIDSVHQRQKAQIDADAWQARAEVIAWKAWAQAQEALVTVRARVVGGAAAVAAAVGSRGYGQRAAAEGYAFTRASTSLVVNINGYRQSPDQLAREVVSALHSAEGRYNTRKYAR